jgi:hypothetical protein
MTKPSNYFLGLRKHASCFFKTKTALLWKLENIQSIFELCQTIVSRNYQIELLVLYSRVANDKQRNSYATTIKAIERLHEYAQLPQLAFLKKRITELKRLHQIDDKGARTAIENDQVLQDLLHYVIMPLLVLRKYPFAVVIAQLCGRHRRNPLFVAVTPEPLAFTEEILTDYKRIISQIILKDQ